ncbi:transglycosylase SLT domain-containing protein [Parvularcula sp. LCG005]|uniref:transglycosylase SLT domain-containing protein n=1 Tax=Parvularcula sp. LCG005 TaxID=3078805 RepID=UPI002941FEB1|nr:transglycosylase SLT domain-containing protein [Parvularcula sp. LCG005]WOI54510.1 transglycosylase SLT domain-containing protein [Parvularcula sp. LCG005]
MSGQTDSVDGPAVLIRLLTVFCLIIVSGCSTTPPDRIGDVCEIFKDRRSWYRATHAAEKEFGTPKALQLAIIRQESSFRHNAKPPRGRFLFVFPGKRLSSARGYSQALDTTWEVFKNETGRRSAERDKFDDAAQFVAWYVARTSNMTGIAQDDAYRQYLAYHEGPAGFLRGTFEGKPGVKDAAARVDWIYRTYDAQLSQCEKKFRRGIPFIPGI